MTSAILLLLTVLVVGLLAWLVITMMISDTKKVARLAASGGTNTPLSIVLSDPGSGRRRGCVAPVLEE